MRICVVGANGFIAREILATLSKTQHALMACAHRYTSILENLSYLKSVIYIDFEKSTISEWLSILKNVDIVINCVGLFSARRAEKLWKIHYEAPCKLYDACVQAHVKKIIHISALCIEQVDNPYAKSKMAIEKKIETLPIDSVIIRPSFVYGKDCYGGSAFFRALASLPFITFIPGRGDQLLQPIHIHDLAGIVKESISFSGKHLLCAVGAEKVSTRLLLSKLRAWLGFKKAKCLSFPMKLLTYCAKLGNWCSNAPVSTTAIDMLSIDNVATPEQESILKQTISFVPRTFSDGLESMSSGVQDRWHARLYFLRPALRFSIAFIWMFTGIISVIGAHQYGYPILTKIGTPAMWQPILLYGGSVVDFVLGLFTLSSRYIKFIGSIQFLLIIFYTCFLSFTLPSEWLHPFGSLAKNIPLLVATLVMIALEGRR